MSRTCESLSTTASSTNVVLCSEFWVLSQRTACTITLWLGWLFVTWLAILMRYRVPRFLEGLEKQLSSSKGSQKMMWMMSEQYPWRTWSWDTLWKFLHTHALLQVLSLTELVMMAPVIVEHHKHASAQEHLDLKVNELTLRAAQDVL